MTRPDGEVPRTYPARTADTIASLRAMMDMTLAEFGERIGVTAKAVSNWELGLHWPSEYNWRQIERLSQ